MKELDLRLYLVTDRSLSLDRPLEWVVEEAVKGGVTMVQLREKNTDSLTFYKLAVRMKELLKPYHVPLIINDRLDIALAVDAEGLHIGQRDLPYAVARQLLGSERIIGLSVENETDALTANDLDVDYIGLSPIYSTPTKTDTAPGLGLEGIRRISQFSRHQTVAIGGINLQNTLEIMEAGANGVAVVSALMSATDPQETARSFRQQTDQGIKH